MKVYIVVNYLGGIHGVYKHRKVAEEECEKVRRDLEMGGVGPMLHEWVANVREFELICEETR